MISLETARALKEAGLNWIPANYDFFAIPDRGFDDQVFVISNMTIQLRDLAGRLAVTFEGAVEWALDHIMVAELIWLPSEAQLRGELEERLGEPSLRLISLPAGYRCEIEFQGRPLGFEATTAEETYAAALLYVLKRQPRSTF
ncbi:MAG: hypothetical protein KatS3mg057_0337 [Herpetosiphonaceae bacterium]|nr:MAG: hypothetical protein KatS3mg057_0337 [Herpetosiphonaceae bacterium]